jgi:hypothetical protein
MAPHTSRYTVAAALISLAPLAFAIPTEPYSPPVVRALAPESSGVTPVVRIGRDAVTPLTDAAKIGGADWAISTKETPVEGALPGREYAVTFLRQNSEAKKVDLATGIAVSGWTKEHFVLVPSSVYAGNRFAYSPMKYPPLWRDPKSWRLDMPVTIARMDTPHLGGPNQSTALRMDVGDASTPLIAAYDPVGKRGHIVMFRQSNGAKYGNTGYEVREAGSSGLLLSVGANDGVSLAPGESFTATVRVFDFAAASVQDLYEAVFLVRKGMNPSSSPEVLPFDAAFGAIRDAYAEHRWDEKREFFWITDAPKGFAAKPMNFMWQLGWVGGGQITLPFILKGDELTRSRAMRNLGRIFTQDRAESGFYYTMADAKGHYPDGFGSAHPHDMTMIRKQADWLYCALKQFAVLKSRNQPVPATWNDGARGLADAFVAMWKKHGQFGQFFNLRTGEIQVGGSASGSGAPGALALASVRYGNPEYLAVAEAAADKYDIEYAQKGYTTGGPGEILSAPDSESAFAMLESFVVLHEVTGKPRWRDAARRMAAQCATWVVSYDFAFPPNSPMGRSDARSTGAVWASVVNRHGAPGPCTLSADSLFRLWRSTGDPLVLDLARDIARGMPQYLSMPPARPLGTLKRGGICERVNLSTWEGRDKVGGNLFASCSWCETALMLGVTEFPGLYVRPDSGVFVAFDHIRAEKVAFKPGGLTLRLTNPTKYTAKVAVFSETGEAALRPLPYPLLDHTREIVLAPGETREESFR